MKTAAPRPPLMDRIRLAIGMRWRRERPGLREIAPALRIAGLIAFMVLAWGIVGRLDYETARAAELEAKADSLAYRASIADDMTERYRIARLDAEHYQDYVIACLRGDREWVLGGQRWECTAKPVGPYIKEN